MNDYMRMVARRRAAGVQELRRTVRFEEFRQVVRRHRPSVLLPALAALTVGSGEPFDRPTNLETYPPWAVALAARESILWSNEHRNARFDGDDLRVLFNAHNDLYESDLPGVSKGVLGLLTRIAFEQFPYGESIFEEVSRSHAMLIDKPANLNLKVLANERSWQLMLGMPLGLAVGATFLLQVAANENAGWYDPAWLDRHDLAEILEQWPRYALDRRLADLSSTFAEFKADYAAAPKPAAGLERYAYNPLTRRPFVLMPDGRYLAPQPRLILRTISPGALFPIGKEVLGDAFAHDLGTLVEAYVGRQLRTLGRPADVYPEITYGKSHVKSIDWFLVLPSALVMFEVKSARFGLLEKAAMDGFEERSKGLLNRAVKQLGTTSSALDAGRAELAHIPKDVPRIGVVVTAEPHYLSNSPWMRDLTISSPFPTLVASLREIEKLVTLSVEEVARQLTKITSDPSRSTWNLGNALQDAAFPRRNPLLEEAWAAYPLLRQPEHGP